MADDTPGDVVPLPPGSGTLRADLEAGERLPPLPSEDGRRKHGDGGLPDGCPVRPLGRHGAMSYYLDVHGVFREVEDSKHQRTVLKGLFSNTPGKLFLYGQKGWVRHNKDGTVTGINWDIVHDTLLTAAGDRGTFDANDKLRGPGGWRNPGGELVLHLGDLVITRSAAGESVEAPGLSGGSVYSAAPPLPHPWVGRVKPDAGEALLGLLESWAWQRGRLDATLMLGFVGCAIYGGALRWRPVVWVTGGRMTGKSTLLDYVLKPALGAAMIAVANPSAAGIWQKLQRSTRTVAVDELEADVDNRKAQDIVNLAQLAASGALMLRGAADHTGVEFVCQSCFLFQSILIPPLRGAAWSRLCVLDLQPLGDRARPDLDPVRIGDLGRKLLRRMIDQWPRFEATFERYREQLMAGERGLDQRGGDLYGALLAAAELALYDDAPDRDGFALEWCEQVQATARDAGADDDEVELMAHLLSSRIDPFRSGDRRTLAEWLLRGAGRDPDYTEHAAARRIVETYGLKVLPRWPPPSWGEKPIVDDRGNAVIMLAVANRHTGLAELLRDTHWAGGSGRQAVWTQATRRLARRYGGIEQAPKPLWFAGVASRAAVMPLAAVMPADPDPPARPPVDLD